MALNFPNASRSYDSTRHAVRFWGYDSAMETSFFVMADALRHLQPGIEPDEESLLQAFDSIAIRSARSPQSLPARQQGFLQLGPTDF